MQTDKSRLRTRLEIILYFLFALWIFEMVAGLLLLLHRAGILTAPWAAIESLSTAVAVIVAIVGAFVAYRDTARDRHLDVADRLFQDFNSDTSIEARRVIYQELPDFSASAVKQLTHEQRTAIKRTLNTFDRAGFMIQSQWIPAKLILPWISPMVVNVWVKVGHYVNYEKDRKRDPDYYASARELVRLCYEWREKHVKRTEFTKVDHAI